MFLSELSLQLLDIHVPLRINFTNFGDPLTFPLVLSSGQKCLFNLIVQFFGLCLPNNKAVDIPIITCTLFLVLINEC